MTILKGWRTIVANALLAILPLLEVAGQLFNMPEIQSVIPSNWLPWYMLGVALLNMILRKITTTPMGQKY